MNKPLPHRLLVKSIKSMLSAANIPIFHLPPAFELPLSNANSCRICHLLQHLGRELAFPIPSGTSGIPAKSWQQETRRIWPKNLCPNKHLVCQSACCWGGTPESLAQSLWKAKQHVSMLSMFFWRHGRRGTVLTSNSAKKSWKWEGNLRNTMALCKELWWGKKSKTSMPWFDHTLNLVCILTKNAAAAQVKMQHRCKLWWFKKFQHVNFAPAGFMPD